MPAGAGALAQNERFPSYRGGNGLLSGMLASTLLGNVPINNRVLGMSPETDGEEFVELRKRWDRLHTLRVSLNVAGLAFLCLGALRGDDRR